MSGKPKQFACVGIRIGILDFYAPFAIVLRVDHAVTSSALKSTVARTALVIGLLLLGSPGAGGEGEGASAFGPLEALPRHLRIDLKWVCHATEGSRVEIQRAVAGSSEFRTIRRAVCRIPIYSDFLGQVGQSFSYRVRSLSPRVSAWSRVVTGTSRGSTASEFLTEVQEASVRYFYDFAHPHSGLARERSHHLPDQCATGATGMGFFNLIVGIQRGFITREQGAGLSLKALRFLSEAQRFHGAWSHWIDGRTGRALPFSAHDDGADLVETAFLAQGLILLRGFFSGRSAVESEIRDLADRLWRGIEWDWFVQNKGDRNYLLWHWSPNYGWEMNLPVRGFNECQIVYVLALASPTHSIPMKCYTTGWQHDRYGVSREHFGIRMELNHGIGPPLFFAHYSYLGLDPRTISYKGRTYFTHFRDFCRVQVLYARSRRDEFDYYGRVWGFTSSMDPGGYSNHRPGSANDNGTIAPTASIASMPYLPAESLSCLRVLYETYGADIWDAFGFRDAFNPARNWVAPGSLGIDVGPIAPMIENYRSGLCWKTFMEAPEIRAVVATLGDLPQD